MLDGYAYESGLWSEGFQRVMGLDEVGRGCLAGPVVAAGVILKPGIRLDGIADSKKLSAPARSRMEAAIKENALYWVVCSCSNEEIDRINILKASLLAMKRCIESDQAIPDYLLVDGNKEVDVLLPQTVLVSGDQKSVSIGAASILAKVERDRIMKTWHNSYPEFGWDKNVGYPTKVHYSALAQYGVTPLHRTSFRLGTTKEYVSEMNVREDKRKADLSS
ncbi:ribonuclease HII [Balneolaceae bacterium ANBcel3]|nr:ribonuclease HII [Balneolaceae bacterium ANBcel3]